MEHQKDIELLDIYKSYKKSPYLSIKHSSYFQVYAELLDGYRGNKITFVEIGVLNGGSLFMWRQFFVFLYAKKYALWAVQEAPLPLHEIPTAERN